MMYKLIIGIIVVFCICFYSLREKEKFSFVPLPESIKRRDPFKVYVRNINADLPRIYSEELLNISSTGTTPSFTGTRIYKTKIPAKFRKQFIPVPQDTTSHLKEKKGVWTDWVELTPCHPKQLKAETDDLCKVVDGTIYCEVNEGQTCGTGAQEYIRYCDNNNELERRCDGKPVESRDCWLKDCPTGSIEPFCLKQQTGEPKLLIGTYYFE